MTSGDFGVNKRRVREKTAQRAHLKRKQRCLGRTGGLLLKKNWGGDKWERKTIDNRGGVRGTNSLPQLSVNELGGRSDLYSQLQGATGDVKGKNRGSKTSIPYVSKRVPQEKRQDKEPEKNPRL